MLHALSRCDLRHFYASWHINRRADGGLEFPPKIVQYRRGHSSIIVTLDTCTHLFPRGDGGAELAEAEKGLVMTTPIDALTLATVPVLLYFNGRMLGNGTSFVYRRGSQSFLITNWHIVTARHAQTGQHLLEGGARPNILRHNST